MQAIHDVRSPASVLLMTKARWLKRFAVVLLALFGILAAGCEEAPLPPREYTVVQLKPSSEKLPTLLAEEYKKATAAGRRPFVEMGAPWCTPCRKLHESMDDRRMILAFAGTYIIQMNVDNWSRELLAAGYNPDGIPAFYEVNSEGYSTGRGIRGGDWNGDDPASDAAKFVAYFHGR